MRISDWSSDVCSSDLIAGKYLKKGSKVYVEGSLRTRKWEKDGVTRYTTEIRVQDMQMLDVKPGGGSASMGGDDSHSGYGNSAPSRAPARSSAPAAAAPADMDAPFEDDEDRKSTRLNSSH